MHAAVLHALGKPPRFEEFPDPVFPGPSGDVGDSNHATRLLRPSSPFSRSTGATTRFDQLSESSL